VKDLPPAESERFAIVTGAGAGIGRATTDMLVTRGWRVGAFDSDAAALGALLAETGADHVLTLAVDVTDDAAWAAAVAAFAQWSSGRLHLLVNNAGIIAVGGFGEVPLATARRMLDVNVMGVANGIYACLALLSATPGARIINVSSIAALSGWPYSSLYSATKAATYNLTEALAAEFEPLGIAVCDVLPSFIGTHLVSNDQTHADVREVFRRYNIVFSPPGRVAEHIVAAIDSRKMHHVVGRQGTAYALICRYLPGLARFMSRGFGRRYVRIIADRQGQPPPSDASRASDGQPPSPPQR
jgi:NADP-dependent 3-hydroxy acid dehydrogenase YdfG